MSTFVAANNSTIIQPDGLMVDATMLQSRIKHMCHYIQHVTLAVKDRKHLAALVIANKKLLQRPSYLKTPEEGCFCPRSLPELAKCLSGCIGAVNHELGADFAKVGAAVIITSDLSSDEETLALNDIVFDINVIDKYRNYLENLFGAKKNVELDYVNIRIE